MLHDRIPIFFFNLSIKHLLRGNPNLITLLCYFEEGNKVCFIPINSAYTKVKKGNWKFVLLPYSNIHNS
jgi:hypothetical protein